MILNRGFSALEFTENIEERTFLTISLMTIHAKLYLTMNNYINKLSRLYIEKRNYLSGPLV